MPLILPEFFALLGIDLFLLLSLLTCLLDARFPKAMPYIFQVAALIGFGHLLVSRNFLDIFGEYMRFWYCFIYLVVALVNIVTVNIYFATSQRIWTMAKAWAGAVTFPTIVISVFFVSNYGFVANVEFPFLLLQVSLVICAIVLGASSLILLSPDILIKFRKRKGVN